MRDNPPITGSAQRRVEAPVAAVWSELTTPESLMATMPIEQVHVDDQRRAGTFIARLGVGPFGISRHGSGAITEAQEPSRVVFELALDDHSMRSVHTAELKPAGDGDTLLDYHVELYSAQPMPRLRRFLSGVFDLHVRDYADHVQATASRHWRAERALGLHDQADG